MKKRIIIIVLFLSAVLNAQIITYQQIKSIENEEGESSEYGVYYKDFNNVFDNFTGTYEYSGNDFYFKIILIRKNLSNANNWYWQDMIVGGYQYINTGVGINMNYLDEVTNSLSMTDGRLCIVEGSWIRNSQPFYCPECLPEKWLSASIKDRVTDNVARLNIARKIQNGESGFQLSIRFEGTVSWREGEPAPVPSLLPVGEFFVKKIAD